MKKFFQLSFCTLFLSCVLSFSALAKCDICEWRTWFDSPQKQKKIVYVMPNDVYVNDEPYIGLQNLENRNVVRCYSNEEYSAEHCARYFEKFGYVRFRDIPYKTANYDFLKVDTYPTRRWRDSESTPRW